ncbi:MAG: hypothetical protein ACRDHH_07020 [Actinomycetota bacterium]
MRRLVLVPMIGLLLGITGSQALAKAPPVVIPFQDQFDAVNPCTGQLTTVLVTGTLRIHQFYNAAGDVHHFNIMSVAELESADGFSGSEVFVNTHNAEGPFRPTEEEDRGMQVVIDNIVAHNPDTGQTVRAQFALHLTYVGGEFVVNSTSLSTKCLGAPA